MGTTEKQQYMKTLKEIQEWLDANTVNRCDDDVIRGILCRHGFSPDDVNGLTFKTSRLGANQMVYEFIKWLEEGRPAGKPHMYRLFLESGEVHDIVADDIIVEEDGDVCCPVRHMLFLLDGGVVARTGDVEFVLLDPEEDDED